MEPEVGEPEVEIEEKIEEKIEKIEDETPIAAEGGQTLPPENAVWWEVHEWKAPAFSEEDLTRLFEKDPKRVPSDVRQRAVVSTFQWVRRSQ